MDEPSGRRLARSELVKLLSASIGNDKAEEAVLAVCAELQLKPAAFSLDEVLQVLEKIAAQPGIIGVTARFAKSRAHLRWGKEG